MKKKERNAVVLFVSILLLAFVVRICDACFLHREILMTGNIFQNARIDANGVFLPNEISLINIYTYLLSLFMMIFGNSEIAVISLHIVLQIIGIVLLYWSMQLITNMYVGAIASFLLAILPWYVKKIYIIDTFHLLCFLLVVILFVFALIFVEARKSIEKRKYKYIYHEKEEIIEENKEQDTRVITLNDIIGTENKEEKKEEQECYATPLGMKEIRMEDIDKHKKEVKYIENPLPVPKRREHKQMDYAIELNTDNDDYDITDMTNMDFFDVE